MEAAETAKQFAAPEGACGHALTDNAAISEVVMHQPKTLIETRWRDSVTELSALYLLTTVAAVHWLSVHWLVAFLLAPLLIGGGLLTLTIAVHLLWLATISLDRIGSLLGLRKSPLA